VKTELDKLKSTRDQNRQKREREREKCFGPEAEFVLISTKAVVILPGISQLFY